MKEVMRLIVGVALTAAVMFAQTKPLFEVATVRPAAPLDMAKIQAAILAGQAPKIGPHVAGTQAEYSYMTLRDLIALAYGLKSYQVTGPDSLAGPRFDILAKLPEGASKEDAPRMLQTLLEERFRLMAHRSSAEHPVYALVVGKGGPKLRESTGKPAPIDENAPLKPGEIVMNSPDGPFRLAPNKDGGTDVNRGLKGSFNYRTNPNTQTVHMEAAW